MGTNERRRRMFFKQLVLVIGAVALLAYAGMRVVRSYAEAELVHIYFAEPSGQKSGEFKLELARDTLTRVKGLKYRKSLPADGGMLFVFPKEQVQSFWMRDTYISLDMIFVGADLKVVGVLSDVPVLNDQPRKVEAASLYVVELPAGTAKKAGIGPGAVAVIKGEVPRGV